MRCVTIFMSSTHFLKFGHLESSVAVNMNSNVKCLSYFIWLGGLKHLSSNDGS